MDLLHRRSCHIWSLLHSHEGCRRQSIPSIVIIIIIAWYHDEWGTVGDATGGVCILAPISKIALRIATVDHVPSPSSLATNYNAFGHVTQMEPFEYQSIPFWRDMRLDQVPLYHIQKSYSKTATTTTTMETNNGTPNYRYIQMAVAPYKCGILSRHVGNATKLMHTLVPFFIDRGILST
eukprot:scaffold90196_cov67-Attheya_sp.AAC.1